MTTQNPNDGSVQMSSVQARLRKYVANGGSKVEAQAMLDKSTGQTIDLNAFLAAQTTRDLMALIEPAIKVRMAAWIAELRNKAAIKGLRLEQRGEESFELVDPLFPGIALCVPGFDLSRLLDIDEYLYDP